MDFQSLKKENNIVDVIGRYVTLTKRGAEHEGICPFHADTKASLKVNERKQIFSCFACGTKGDVVDFLTSMGKAHKEAAEELSGGIATDAAPQKRKAKEEASAPKWVQAMPIDTPASFQHNRHGLPSAKWLYKDAEGKPIGYVCRFDLADGKKETLPYIYATDGTVYAWRWLGFDKPRPLYNLHALASNPNATVLIVEGEKCAEAAQAQLDASKVVVTTWLGGANGVHKADLSALQGRKAILWPDNDMEGLSAMLHLRTLAGFSACKIIPLDATLPKGWDCADVDWKEGEMRAFVMGRMVDDIPANAEGGRWQFAQIGREAVYNFGMEGNRWTFKEVTQPSPEPAPTPEPAPEPPAEAYDYYADELPPAEQGRGEDGVGETFFRFMGFEKNESGTQKFHFYVFRSNQLVSLSPSAMSKSNLLLLAPLNWWEENFPARKSKFDADAASNWLIESAIKVGIFNTDYVRGRGAWMDGKDTVIHCGGHLIVNGQHTPFNEYKSKYIYEAARELGFEPTKPLTSQEAASLLELAKLINWERPINAYFLAGWCVIAPICGALRWRPHIWITGSAGTGKSWIFEKIVKRMLSQTALAVQSETTEAGIRQYLGQDALPVLFDEAEGEDRRAQERMQAVLTLMRGASTSDGGMIIKGSAGGAATRYSIRSCFAYASIGISLTQQSDRSRVTVLGVQKLQGEEGQTRWRKIQKAYAETVSEDFVASLQSRTVAMLPVILKNADTFAAAAASVLGDQRAGDQVGTLLAGAYSLISAKAITFQEAEEWIQARDWSEEKQSDAAKDEVRLITHLMEAIERVEVVDASSNVRYFERTVGDIVNIAHAPSFYDEYISREAARKTLLKLGYKIDGDDLLVSNTASSIKKVLRDTPWANNHTTILKRLQGAQAKDGTTFGSGVKSRAVAIPITTIFP